MVDVDIADLDAVILRVADKLRRRVKPHGLRIQDRGAEDVRIKGLEPAGGVDEQREGSSVAFGKAVFAKPLDLLEAALGEFPGIVLCDHALDHLVAINFELSIAPEGRHGPAKLVGLAGREAADVDGDLHRLFLEERYAERPPKNGFHFRMIILDLLQSLAAAQIGMDHVALDRAGPDDRHLDDEVVKLFRALGAAASTSARAIRSGKHRACRRGRSCHKRACLPWSSWPSRRCAALSRSWRRNAR